MLDLNLIREKTEEVRTALLKRMDDIDFTELLQWDKERRELIVEIDELRAKRNKVSAQNPLMKKEGKDIQEVVKEMRVVSDRIKEFDANLSELAGKIKSFLEGVPNIPADDVPAGGKENNELIRTWGEKPEFDFEPKDHIVLVNSLNMIDYERGVKMGGNNFWLYKGDGAILEWAIINYFVKEHLKDGYEFILPPHILIYQCGYTAGQFPKFEDDVFQDFIDGMADVNIAIGVGRSVVQDEAWLCLSFRSVETRIQVDVLPVFDKSWLPLGQIGAHGKIGMR